jgi:hypothetical protein
VIGFGRNDGSSIGWKSDSNGNSNSNDNSNGNSNSNDNGVVAG